MGGQSDLRSRISARMAIFELPHGGREMACDPEQSGISLEVRSNDRNLKLDWDVTGPSEPVDLGKTGVPELDMN
jgi:hypothetical protein